MHLRKVHLFNFKNYNGAEFEFSERLNCVLGNNGAGKTNLLDAIYFLCLTKSAFQSSDILLIHEKEENTSVRGIFLKEGKEFDVISKFGRNLKKTIRCNDEVYPRFSDHIGRFSAILIHPHDVDYIRMGSEMRRRLMDGMIALIDHEYLDSLLSYNRLLKQRNHALKSMRDRGKTDHSLLDTYDQQLLALMHPLSERRSIFVSSLIPHFNLLYSDLCEEKEKVSIQYESELSNTDFDEEFKAGRNRDLEACRTLKGIHRDELIFNIDERAIKDFGSQGQQKSFMLALKLSLIYLIDEQPILLLDDVFDRLDAGRIKKLLNFVHNSGHQVFISDARPDRVVDMLEENKLDALIINI